MNGALIWGTLLIIVGLSLIFKTIFGFSIPILRIGFALFLVYLGATMLMAAFGQKKEESSVLFGQKTINGTQETTQDYNVIFGQALIDLSKITVTQDMPITVDIETVFGSTTLKINSSIPTVVKVKAIFANAQLPDDTLISMGKYTYIVGPETTHPHLIINAKVTCGNLVVITT
jgi:hypothetical protein